MVGVAIAKYDICRQKDGQGIQTIDYVTFPDHFLVTKNTLRFAIPGLALGNYHSIYPAFLLLGIFSAEEG